MSLRSRHRPSTDFSLASISDLVFLLLIFFMLTSSFVNQTGVKIELPQSASNTPSDGKSTVTISADGQFFWNSDKVTKEQIRPLLQEVLTDADPNNNTVTLRTDKAVTMEEAAYVISIIAEFKGAVVLATKMN